MTIEKITLPKRLDQERIEALKQLFPEVFADGKLNLEVLQQELTDTIEDEDVGEEHYGLNWPGKKRARKLAVKPSAGTLVPVPGEGLDEKSSKNIFIEGDNLEVLRILKKSYSGRIKMIYIDPPYNTGNDFIYKDNFKEAVETYLQRTGQLDENGLTTSNPKASGRYHSNWLSMMYPRLKLAKNLLRSDGVIFISIDENEHHNLIYLLNEIFGEENFIADFIWKARSGSTGTISMVSYQHEYIVAYSKTPEFKLKMREKVSTGGSYEDKKGKYNREQLRQWGQADRRVDRPSMWFPIVGPNGTKIYPIKDDGTEGRWRVGETKVKELMNSGDLDFDQINGHWQVYKKIREGRLTYTAYGTIIDDVGTTADGTKIIQQLFGSKVMDFPKPPKLIKYLADLATYDDKNCTILDFLPARVLLVKQYWN